ncbi:MAG: EF-P lysine aminoacylase EpmA [Leptospiraceae bacterium]|nr:EF-P lysine aminoacylase EpmA [Leptospiraceae bacterium]
MNLLSYDVLKLRSNFIFSIRKFFQAKEFSEIDTPKLKKIPGMEPNLDPFEVSSDSNPEEGYLVTSPEYSMKIALSQGCDKIYEIAHSYRANEKGNLHTREFLMLEFYQVGINEQELIEVCIELFDFLEKNFLQIGFSSHECIKISMNKLFQEYTGRGFSLEELKNTIEEKKLFISKEDNRYEDYFFLVFLNLIEKHLKKFEHPYFIYNYPPELASLARIEKNRAKRFEIYWKGVELGNGYYELNHPFEQLQRFHKEQDERKLMGKKVFPIDKEFISALERGLPDCSGIAIGLDRLFMIFLRHKDLKFSSPYFGQ